MQFGFLFSFYSLCTCTTCALYPKFLVLLFIVVRLFIHCCPFVDSMLSVCLFARGHFFRNGGLYELFVPSFLDGRICDTYMRTKKFAYAENMRFFRSIFPALYGQKLLAYGKISPWKKIEYCSRHLNLNNPSRKK